jgi:hypothetical protein
MDDDRSPSAGTGTERLRQEVLAALVRVARAQDTPLVLEDLRCEDRIVLDDTTLRCGVVIRRCRLEKGISLARSELGHLRVEASEIAGAGDEPALALRQATVAHDVEITDSTVTGTVDAAAMSVGGDVLLTSSQFTADGPPTISAPRLDLVGRLRIEGVTIAHGLRLSDAHLGGTVDVTAGSSIGPGRRGVAIEASRVMADGRLELRGGSRIDGCFELIGAHWFGHMGISDGVVLGTEQPSGGSRDYGIQGDGLVTGSDLVIVGNGTRVNGGVRLHSATLAGQLVVMGGAWLGAYEGHSLIGEQMRAQELILNSPDGTTDRRMDHPTRTTLEGAIHLADARLGSLRLRPGVRIGRNGWGNSLFALRLQVTGDIRFERPPSPGPLSEDPPADPVHLEGAVVLFDAHVGGSLAFKDGTHVRAGSEDGVTSLDAAGLEITRDLIIAGPATRLDGDVALGGASIHGTLLVDPGERPIFPRLLPTTPRPRRQRLDLSAASVGTLGLRADAGIGLIDLRSCTIGELDDRPASWGLFEDETTGRWFDRLLLWNPKLSRVVPKRWYERSRRHAYTFRPARTHVIAGELTLGRLPADGEFSKAARRAWLGSSRSAHAEDTEVSASRAFHRTFAAVLSQAGDDKAATDVLADMQRRHRGRPARWPLVPVDQGYRPWWAFSLLALLFLLTFGVALWGDRNGAFAATAELPPSPRSDLVTSRDCDPDRYPCLRPVVYTVDLLVPGLDVGETTRWQPATTRDGAGRNDVLRWYLTAARLAGWGLGALVLVGILNVAGEGRRQ